MSPLTVERCRWVPPDDRSCGKTVRDSPCPASSLSAVSQVLDTSVQQRSPDLDEAPESTRVRTVDRRRWNRVGTAAGLSVLVATAALLRWDRLDTHYWIDEAISIGIAKHELTEIPGLLRLDGAPPLWYLLLGVWMRVFGSTPTATHAFSLLIALVTVPVAYWAARSLFGQVAGWYAALLAAVSPFLTYFAGETRMYALVTLLGVVAAAAHAHVFAFGRPRYLPLLVVCLIALTYTHYWGLYFAVASAISASVLALLDPGDRSRLIRRAVRSHAVVAIAFLPWTPMLISQSRLTGAPWAYTPSPRELVSELAALVRDERILVALVLGAGTGLAVLLRQIARPPGRAAASLLALIALPIGLGWVVANIEASWATRYLAVIVGPLIIVAAVGLARSGGTGLAALAITVVLVVQPFTRLGPGVSIPVESKSNATLIAETFDAQLGPNDWVIVTQPEAVPLFRQELGNDFRYADPRGPVDKPRVMDWRNAGRDLRNSTVAAGLQPIIAGLDVGDRVLLVSPSSRQRRTDTEWMQVFRQRDKEWRRALLHDPALARVTGSSPGDGSETTFRATLYERQG